MIAAISPAKRIVPENGEGLAVTKPFALDSQTERIANHMKRYGPWQLESLLKINPELSMEAFTQFQRYSSQTEGAPAILSYRGLAYQAMGVLGNPDTDTAPFDKEDLQYSSSCLRILSAFYGMLRPLDGIQPYRLDYMNQITIKGKRLYALWGDAVYRELFRPGERVINLASEEYAKSFLRYLTPRDHLITCTFRRRRGNKYITIATDAKMARGRMARFIIKNRLGDPENLKEFQWNGYGYSEGLSTANHFIYLNQDHPT